MSEIAFLPHLHRGSEEENARMRAIETRREGGRYTRLIVETQDPLQQISRRRSFPEAGDLRGAVRSDKFNNSEYIK